MFEETDLASRSIAAAKKRVLETEMPRTGDLRSAIELLILAHPLRGGCLRIPRTYRSRHRVRLCPSLGAAHIVLGRPLVPGCLQRQNRSSRYSQLKWPA